MSKHTPGPWVWGKSQDCLFGADAETVLMAGDDGKGFGMHSALIEHHWDTATAEANRRLIAAAPEMYESLRNCLEHMEWSTPQGKAACEQARTVLAKVEG